MYPVSPYLSTRKAAERLGVHPNTLRGWFKDGFIHATRTPGGNRLFQVAEFMACMTRARRANERLGKIMRDVHYKSANFLCSNFTDILLPSLATGSMVQRAGLLAKSTRVGLQVLRHAKFRQRLKHVAQRYPDVRVRACTEWGTTKLCGKCLRRNDPGSSENYQCQWDGCGFVYGRDANSARLITLVNLLPGGEQV